MGGGSGPPAPLPRAFYLRPTLTVARDLPGMIIFRKLGRSLLAARIVEVEAYLGHSDPASHSYRGMTPRNEVMFGEGGHLYVYFTYGMHFCCNVVTEDAGKGRAVLLRAAEPLEGIETMTSLRSGRDGRRRIIRDLLNGPGKLCQGLGIGRGENGTDLCGRTIWIARERGAVAPRRIMSSERIGISRGQEHQWRFFLKDDPFVSR